jgi:hypothetical protein
MNDVTESKPDSPEKFVARLRAIGEAAYHDKHPFHVLMHHEAATAGVDRKSFLLSVDDSQKRRADPRQG